MLTALAVTSTTMSTDANDWAAINTLARAVSGTSSARYRG